VRETAVIELAVSVKEEEPEAANMRRNVAISYAERDGPEEGERVPDEEARTMSSIFL
jgi:hypothetical protein